MNSIPTGELGMGTIGIILVILLILLLLGVFTIGF